MPLTMGFQDKKTWSIILFVCMYVIMLRDWNIPVYNSGVVYLLNRLPSPPDLIAF